MKEFDELLDMANTLLGPEGCPWDKKQTYDTLKPYILEEFHELLEAVDLKDPKAMREELGDCFYALVFLGKLAEQNQIFHIQEALRTVLEKMIRRHPHIFGNVKVESEGDIVRNWEEMKKKEGKKNPIEGIPPGLPALARAQKVTMKLRRANQATPVPSHLKSEEDLGEKLFDLVSQAETSGFDAESALRRACLKHEKKWG
jgi:nucleoside triphosphate diphosphatase